MTPGINVKTTNGSKTLYWMSTLVAALAFAAIGVGNLVRIPKIAEGLLHLGYPAYFGIILGSWELLGSIAIIVPGLPRLKEWTYAGMFFTLTGAALSHAATGDTVGHILVPLALLVAVITSWVLQPARDTSRQLTKTERDAGLQLGEDDEAGYRVTSILIHKS
jgi:uncharacterized membrane protein YphA (DoxX/SURF4 family)